MVAKSDGKGIALYDINPTTGKRSLLVYCGRVDKNGKSTWKTCPQHKDLKTRAEKDDVVEKIGAEIEAEETPVENKQEIGLNEYLALTEEENNSTDAMSPTYSDRKKGMKKAQREERKNKTLAWAETLPTKKLNDLQKSGAKDISGALNEIQSAFGNKGGALGSTLARKANSGIQKLSRNLDSKAQEKMRGIKSHYQRKPQLQVELAQAENRKVVEAWRSETLAKVDAKLAEIDNNISMLQTKRAEFESKKQTALNNVSTTAEQKARQMAVINRALNPINSSLRQYGEIRKRIMARRQQVSTQVPRGLALPYPGISDGRKASTQRDFVKLKEVGYTRRRTNRNARKAA